MTKKKPANKKKGRQKTVTPRQSGRESILKATAVKMPARKKISTIVRPIPQKNPLAIFPEVVIPGVATPSNNLPLPEVAFYYPNPYFSDLDWIRNMILFFDGIGMLIPGYMNEYSRFDDQIVIDGLKEKGLIHIFQPETIFDPETVAGMEACLMV